MNDQVRYPFLFASAPVQEPQKFSIFIEDKWCVECKNIVSENANNLVRIICGHVVHLPCVMKNADDYKNIIRCKICIPETDVPKVAVTSATSPTPKSGGRFTVSDGGDERSRKAIEEICLSDYIVPKIGILQINKLLPTALSLNKESILKNRINFDSLISVGISLPQIYFKLKFEEWEELKKLEFKVSHLKKKELVPISFLNARYMITLDLIMKDYSIGLVRLKQQGNLSAKELSILGFSIEEHLLKQERPKMTVYELGFSLLDWKNHLNLNDDHLKPEYLCIPESEYEVFRWKKTNKANDAKKAKKRHNKKF